MPSGPRCSFCGGRCLNSSRRGSHLDFESRHQNRRIAQQRNEWSNSVEFAPEQERLRSLSCWFFSSLSLLWEKFHCSNNIQTSNIWIKQSVEFAPCSWLLPTMFSTSLFKFAPNPLNSLLIVASKAYADQLERTRSAFFKRLRAGRALWTENMHLRRTMCSPFYHYTCGGIESMMPEGQHLWITNAPTTIHVKTMTSRGRVLHQEPCLP